MTTEDNFCCQMRARFLIAIIREDPDAPRPTDLCDFILDWDRPKPVIAIRFCPFCAEPIDHSQTLRDINP